MSVATLASFFAFARTNAPWMTACVYRARLSGDQSGVRRVALLGCGNHLGDGFGVRIDAREASVANGGVRVQFFLGERYREGRRFPAASALQGVVP